MSLTLSQTQKLIQDIYGIPDDRLYEVEDLLYYGKKFALRYTKQLKMKEKEMAGESLVVCLAWFFALMNRFHFDLEQLVWKRYSYKCPFCMDIPCSCAEKGEKKAKKTGRPSSRKPKDLAEWQEVIKKIYPAGEINELNFALLYELDNFDHAFRKFLREKKMGYFEEIETQSADYLVLMLRIFNALGIDLSKKFQEMFGKGCYVCHKTPCECNYS
jgi:hypothetical protein